ncbi:large conductance mechanosensitive channel protein [Thermobifida halotolerans]
MNGFKKFLFQGNLVQLAVAVVIGAVFSELVTAFTTAFVTPLLGIFGRVPKFADLTFTVNNSEFQYGAFIDALISFVLTATILYFLIVLPMTKVMERFARDEEAHPPRVPVLLQPDQQEGHPVRVLHQRDRAREDGSVTSAAAHPVRVGRLGRQRPGPVRRGRTPSARARRGWSRPTAGGTSRIRGSAPPAS